MGGLQPLSFLKIPKNIPVNRKNTLSSDILSDIISIFEDSTHESLLGLPGTYGIVKKIPIVLNDIEHIYVVKRVRVETRELLVSFRKEARTNQILSTNAVTSRFVPNYMGHSILGNYGYIVQDYEPSIELTTYLQILSKTGKLFPKHIGLEIYEELIKGMRAFHTSHILHNDIKPENILLKTGKDGMPTGQILIIDFGTACLESPCHATEIVGTNEYWPPFVQENTNLRSPYNERTENYSLGKVLSYIIEYTADIDTKHMRNQIDRNFLQPGVNEFMRRKMVRNSPKTITHTPKSARKNTRKVRM